MDNILHYMHVLHVLNIFSTESCEHILSKEQEMKVEISGVGRKCSMVGAPHYQILWACLKRARRPGRSAGMSPTKNFKPSEIVLVQFRQ